MATLLLAACGSDAATDNGPVTGPAPADAAGADAARTEGASSGSATAAETFAQVFSSGTTLDGAEFDGAVLVGADSVVWFWAPWCTICRAEAPEIAEIAERYADQVRIVGVPGRGELDAINRFVDDTGTGAITQVADLDGAIWSAFGVYGQPAYAFIGDDGTVEVFIGGLGGDALAERIDELMAT